MSHTKKTVILVAAIIVAVGAVLCLLAFAFGQNDVRSLNIMKFETKTYDITEPFSNINIDDISYRVLLAPSQDDACHVECHEADTLSHKVSVENDTLTVTQQDNRHWYDLFSFGWGPDMSVIVYLPQAEYDRLSIKSVSGSIEVPAGFDFQSAVLTTTSGKVSFAGTSGSLHAESTSGKVVISNLTRGEVSARSVSGSVSLSDSALDSLSANTASGSITLDSVTVAGSATLECISGGIRFDRFDAQSIAAKTTSGVIKGTLLSAKNFSTHSVSGSVEVPASDSTAGSCNLSAVSGSIRIQLAE